ncbi:U3 small nucleolar ribonucleoprotein complex, subunit Mpp10 [Parasitella parasitica]|nr:U3 small nucleolar ribonucleoprotein complex, subunit Mpp10 [Parasitella parasitica]
MTKNTVDRFISNVVNKPQVFFGSNQKIADSALEVAKHFYDKVKKVEQVQFSPFTELLTEGFDNDQIWEEIASQNEPFLDYAKTALKEFSKKPSTQKQSFTDDDEEEASLSDQSMDLDQQTDEEEDEEEDNHGLDFMDQDNDSEQEDQDMEEQDDEDEVIEPEVLEEEKSSKKTSEVDDEFFNLEEFNKWTDKQEELDMMSDREDQDDEFDFDKDLDEQEDSDEEQDDTEAATEMLYKDFYGAGPKMDAKLYTPKKKVEYQEGRADEEEEEENEQEDMEDLEDMEDNEGPARDLFGADSDAEQEDGQEHSAFQKQQARLQAQIEEYEEENIQDKHWTLRGEAAAKSRPVNSLLEEDLEFEHANKPVPVITQESTNTLEEMIKKRILDNMFDDVERKVDPTLRPFVPSKRVELSDEKAKQSLADMYEDDFVRKQAGQEKKDVRDEALEKEHDEISNLFSTLCHKLDALSNFHYTPKAAKPEMTIVSNSAAISMEEVTPINVSDATLLAPEEVYDKKRGDVKVASEMDQDERKRQRAQKKKLKRKERDMKEREQKIMQKYNPQMGQRKAKTKAVKELLGQKNVTVIGKDGQKKTTTKQVTSASLF